MLRERILQVTPRAGPMKTGLWRNRNMSCWVVPTVAAELWGVSVQQVLDAILSGSITSRHDSDFTFVDVAPGSPNVRRPKPFRNDPPTFTAITDEELLALMADDAPAPTTQSIPEEIASPTSDEIAALIEMGDWRRARGITSTKRKAPARPTAA